MNCVKKRPHINISMKDWIIFARPPIVYPLLVFLELVKQWQLNVFCLCIYRYSSIKNTRDNRLIGPKLYGLKLTVLMMEAYLLYVKVSLKRLMTCSERDILRNSVT